MNEKQFLISMERIKKYVDKQDSQFEIRDTNKYFLIKDNTPLTFKRSDLTDDETCLISVENLTGLYGNLVINDDDTYTYTLTKLMVDVDLFVFTIGNIKQNVLIVPYKKMKYDDTVRGLTYIGAWNPVKDVNFYEEQAHKVTKTPNEDAYCSFRFTGTGIDLISKLDINGIDVLVELFDEKDTCIVNKNIILKSDIDYYKASIFKHSFSYGSYTLKITVNKGDFYLDSLMVYNSILDTNTVINDMYYKEESKDMNTGLRTDGSNAPYEPTNLYDPSTKKYVDDTVINLGLEVYIGTDEAEANKRKLWINTSEYTETETVSEGLQTLNASLNEITGLNTDLELTESFINTKEMNEALTVINNNLDNLNLKDE